MLDEHDHIKESIAAFIIEGPGSEPELEEHLASCEECRAEVAQMRETIGLFVSLVGDSSVVGVDYPMSTMNTDGHSLPLVLLTGDQISNDDTSVPPLDNLVNEMQSADHIPPSLTLIAENRILKRRILFSKIIAVAASIVAVASLVTLLAVHRGGNYVATVSASPASATINMVSPDSTNAQMGTLIAEPRGWGSQLVLTMKGLSPGKVYRIVVVSGTSSEVAGGYSVPRSGTLHVIAASSILANKISGVEIVANDGKTYSRSA